MTEKPKPIEVTPPLKTASWETKGGPVTTFKLRLMTREQIEAHGLTQYIKGANNDEENE